MVQSSLALADRADFADNGILKGPCAHEVISFVQSFFNALLAECTGIHCWFSCRDYACFSDSFVAPTHLKCIAGIELRMSVYFKKRNKVGALFFFSLY